MWGSPLARGRGLKQVPPKQPITHLKSPLARGRGLKLIETAFAADGSGSPLARGRGLKHERMRVTGLEAQGRPSRGGVD